MHKLGERLVKEGIIKNPDVSKIMEHVDRKYYAPFSPYYDSPQSIGFGATISAPHMHAWLSNSSSTNLGASGMLLMSAVAPATSQPPWLWPCPKEPRFSGSSMFMN
jgi:hypothetical protein